MVHRLAFILRPIQNSDGSGGFYENYSDPLRAFVSVTVHANKVTATVRKGCDLRANDIFDIEGQWYRVVHIGTFVDDMYFSVDLEKIQRPMTL
jgi:hypothetical protein